MTIDELYQEIEQAISEVLEVQEYEIDDKRVRKPRLRELADYQDRMLAKKARQDNNYKSNVYVRFKFPK